MKRPRDIVILSGILLLAAGLRGLYLAELVRNPLFGDPGVDALYHDYWAHALVTGDWTPPPGFEDPQIRTTPFLRPPGYPYFLSLVYRVASCSRWTAERRYAVAAVVQMALGLASCAVGFAFARRWFGGAVALVFAAFLGTYWIFIYYEGELVEPVLLVLLLLLLVHALSGWAASVTLPRALLAGVLLGLTALVRPNILLFVVPAAAWACWITRRARPSRRGRFGVAVLGLAAGAAIAIAPATVRNWVVARDFVLISANGGVNLWIGNNERANGRFVTPPGLERFDDCFRYPELVRNLEVQSGRPMRYSDVARHYARLAIDYVKSHPGRALRLAGQKLLLFWGPVEVHHNVVEWGERRNSLVLWNTPLSFPTVLALAIVGTAMFFLLPAMAPAAPADAAPRRQQAQVVVLVLLLVATWCVSFLPFFVVAQYRAPVVALLLLPAAMAVVRIVVLARAGRVRSVAISAAACAVLAGLASVNKTGYKPDLAKWHFDRGTAYQRKGRADDAMREYAEAVRVGPTYVDARLALADALMGSGRSAEAVEHYEAAIRARRDNCGAYISLGIALRDQGRIEDAGRAYEHAARCAPDSLEARINLGVVLQELGRLDDAIRVYRDALRINPDSGMAWYNLALVLYGTGRFAEAWHAVGQCRRCGETLPPDFLQALSARMAEPRP